MSNRPPKIPTPLRPATPGSGKHPSHTSGMQSPRLPVNTASHQAPEPKTSDTKALMTIDGMRQVTGILTWGTGIPHSTQRQIQPAEITHKANTTSTKTGPLVMEDSKLYVYVVDIDRGLTYAKEQEPGVELETKSKGVTHPILTQQNMGQASIGGEMVMVGGILYFNTKSAGYSQGVGDKERAAVKTLLQNLFKNEYHVPLAIEFQKDLDSKRAPEEL